MNCIKRLGERVISRTFERQVNELHIRAAISINSQSWAALRQSPLHSCVWVRGNSASIRFIQQRPWLIHI